MLQPLRCRLEGSYSHEAQRKIKPNLGRIFSLKRLLQRTRLRRSIYNRGSVLIGEQISRHLDERRIIIDPILDKKQIGAVSVDLRLDSQFGEFQSTRRTVIDPGDENPDYVKFSEIEFYKDKYSLQAGHFVLGKTFEYIALPDDVVGLLEGRSSVGRQGLMIHVTAGVVDPGFKGHLVFELANVGKMPILLYPLMRVARITFVKTKPTQEYIGKFRVQLSIKIPDVDPDVLRIKAIMKESENTVAIEKGKAA